MAGAKKGSSQGLPEVTLSSKRRQVAALQVAFLRLHGRSGLEDEAGETPYRLRFMWQKGSVVNQIGPNSSGRTQCGPPVCCFWEWVVCHQTHLEGSAAGHGAVKLSKVARKSVLRTEGHESAIRATGFSSVETAIRDAEIRFAGFYRHAQHPPIDQDV